MNALDTRFSYAAEFVKSTTQQHVSTGQGASVRVRTSPSTRTHRFGAPALGAVAPQATEEEEEGIVAKTQVTAMLKSR